MKPNKFTYQGETFDSLTDTRWAVYLDKVGIEYEYKQETVKTHGQEFKPTFFLPEYEMWAEVKPESHMGIEFNDCRFLALGTKKPVILIKGTPDLRPYPVITPGKNSDITMGHLNLVPIGTAGKPQLPKNVHLNSELEFYTLGSAGISAVKAIKVAQNGHTYKSEDYHYKGQRYSSLDEYGWARYFDEMGIRYTPKISAEELSGGIFIWPTFYLSDHKIWALVANAHLDAFEYECAKALCIEKQKPVLILDGVISEKYYSMLMPEKDGNYDVQITNVIRKDGKLLTGMFLKGREAFINYGEAGKEAVRVIDRIRDDSFK